MSIVLAVEPDSTQASILRKILRGHIDADVIIVSTKDAAIEAISGHVPDLVLVSTLLPPRDENGLFAHLRSLDSASHLQTLTIPQLRRKHKPVTQGVLSRFRKKVVAPEPAGCDPNLFFQEVESYLARARELLSHPPAASSRAGGAAATPHFTLIKDPTASLVAEPVAPETAVLESALPESVFSESAFPEPPFPEPVFAEPAAQEPTALERLAPMTFEQPFVPMATEAVAEPLRFEEPAASVVKPDAEEWVDLELDRLIQHLGLESTRVEVREREVELAQAEADAQATLAVEIERVQQEAEAHRQAELARVQAEAEAERVLAVEQARAEAEEQARSALAAELARVRTDAEHVLAEAEQTRLSEIARVQAEADERIDAAAKQAREAAEADASRAMMAELARVRAEVEQTLNGQLERARAEAEDLRNAELARVQAEAATIRAAAAEDARVAAEEARAAAEAAASRALEAEVTRVRAEAEARLRAELETIRQEAANMRLAEQSEARQSAEKVREAALRDTRAIAEAANHTLESELRRVRSEADARLEAELAKTRAEVEQQRAAELEEIRAQVAEMREAAALHARTAAAEAIASEVARAAAEAHSAATRRAPSVVKVQAAAKPAAATRAIRESAVAPEPLTTETWTGQDSVDYYSLWKAESAPPPASAPETAEPDPPSRDFLKIIMSSRAKWAALPAAALLLLILNAGLSIGRGWKPDASATQPVAMAGAGMVAPAEPAVKLGEIQVDVTPAGAQVLLDGAKAGQAPTKLSGVTPGKHTIVLQSAAGSVTRKIKVRPGETAHVTESIFSGWLAIFSGVPLTITLDGKPRGTTEDGQLALAPGTYDVSLASDRFNYHETRSVKIEPGQIASYSVKLPVTALRLDAPEGMEIAIDGQSAGVTPLTDLSVPIGTHEVSGRGADGVERHRSIEAKSGEAVEVSLNQ